MAYDIPCNNKRSRETFVGPHLRSQRKSDPRVAACADRGGVRNLLYACASRIVLRKLNLLAKLLSSTDGTLSARSFRTLTAMFTVSVLSNNVSG